MLKGLLLLCFEEMPPGNIAVGQLLKPQKATPIGEALAKAGLPVRKGRVIKRGDISR
jgi:hypothetical protein